MGHDKLRKFAENETFNCLLQPSAQEVLADGYFHLRDHEIKGNWNKRMFAKDQPIVLELGCGKGEYTIDLARRNPQFNYIGVDIKGARLWKGAKFAHEHSLGNVAFLRTRIEFITAFFAPGEVSEIWLTFSDPQMKSENSRLSSPLFLERYRRFMKPGGIVHLKTDSRFLHEYTKAVCAANSLQVLACTADLYSTPRESLLTAEPAAGLENSAVDALYEVQTFYERMFLQQGYKITYMSFIIDHEGEYVHPEFDEEYWRGVEGPRRSFDHQPTKGHKPE
ncbi:MAG: tRNA (guanosine(46)-N7)-methyltransferase TrmB [Bacteroidia bacterium]|nr:tRNA (guanosine(46)-N7)-methyltransferase TrmB [Bacteroidia bacterium]